jgi:hypothetical protein
MTAPLCILRSVWYSIRARARVSGHAYRLQRPVAGQPACVEILRCEVCGHHSVGWRTCGRCGEGLHG